MSRHIDYDYVWTHYKDVEDRFRKVYKAYKEERKNNEMQSPEHTAFQAFKSQVKMTYFDYEEDAKEMVEMTGDHWTLMSPQADDLDKYLGAGLVF